MRALPQPGAAAHARGRSRWTARRSCRSACSARSATGSTPGRPCAHLTLAVAGWIRYASGSDERGNAFEVQDPLAPEFRQIVRDAGGDPGPVADGFLDLASVFGTDLVAHYAFREAVRAHVIALFRDGAKATLARHLGVA